MRDLGPEAPPTHILAVGNYARPLEEVQPGFLTILDPGPAKITPAAGGQSTGRRTALAKWLADPANPLTARVRSTGSGIITSVSESLPPQATSDEWASVRLTLNSLIG